MKYLTAVLLIVSICGCLPSARPGTKQDRDRESTKLTSSVPKVVIDANGKPHIRMETMTYSYTSDKEQSESPPLTLWEKIKRWIAGLSLLGGVLVLAGFGAPVGMAIGWLWRALRNAKTGMQELVWAIKDANAVKDDNELEQALKNRTSDITRRIVADIKARL